jgi:hypothetical protein
MVKRCDDRIALIFEEQVLLFYGAIELGGSLEFIFIVHPLFFVAAW